MSSLTRRMQKNSGTPGKIGRNVGIPKNDECKCCKAKAAREEKATS